MPDVSDLPLAERSGLPDELAYLRGAYPATGWRKHTNFGELAAFWLHVHESLRVHGGQIHDLTEAFRAGGVDPTAFQRAFVPGLNQFLQHLHAHHSIEDGAYFPKFRALDPRMVKGFDLLEADHGLIDQTLHASVDSARALLGALAAGDRDATRSAADAYAADSARLQGLLKQHLADEEDLVIPALLEHGERAVA